jgi:hypothetical protein
MMKFICKMATTAAVVGLYLVLPVASAQEKQGRTGRGLVVLYDFAEATGQTVHDRSGVGAPLDLVIDKSTGVRWSKGVLSVESASSITSAQPAKKVIDAVKKSNAITIEAWLKPASNSQSGPARIVSLSADTSQRNVTLGQDQDFYDVRLRTTGSDSNGLPSTASPQKSLQPKLTHVVFTRDAAGTAIMFIDGKQVVSKKVDGKLGNWDATLHLALANEVTKDRPWLGDMHLVAIFDQALSVKEVQQNFAAGTQSRPAAAATVAENKPTPPPAVAEKKPTVTEEKKPAPVKVATEKEVIDARNAEEQVLVAKIAAQTALSQKASALAKAVAAEKAAADKLVAAKTPPNKAAAEKALAGAKQATAARTAEKVAAEKALAEKDAALNGAIAKSAALLASLRGGLQPLDAKAWDYAKARHLLIRAGFGGTPDETARLHARGLHAAVDYMVDFHRQPTPEIEFSGVPPERPDPLENKYSGAVRNRINMERTNRENAQLASLRSWWLKRMVESPRPLEEKLTLFWHGHFATQYSVVQNGYAFYLQNRLFRDNAAGNFGALLYGIAHDPVMIRYLNNNDNYKGHPNENLAREIMELFAMGLDQGYTEDDIREAARALTGYNFDHYTAQFRYVDSQHDTGNKTIFGKTGNWSGDDLVRLILEQPATASFISEKLFHFFAYQDPDKGTVDRLASVMRTNNYELAAVLKNMFLSEEFYSARSMGTQIKSPVQLTVGMLRDFGVKEINDCRPLDTAIQGMGQTLFEPPDVKGWRLGPDWIDANRIFIRYNSLANLLRSVDRPETRGVDVVALLDGENCKSPTEVVDCLVKACFVTPLDDERRKELVDFLKDLPAQSEWEKQRSQVNGRLQALLVLLLSTPDYQMS